MFNKTQIESYQNITAPADLKARVFEACQNTKEVKSAPFGKKLYTFAPMAACLVLCFLLLIPSLQNEQQAFYLMSSDVRLDSQSIQLPPPAQETESLARTISMEPRLYSIFLQTGPDVEILSADGDASLDEAGNLTWNIHVPEEDMVFELTLQAGDRTYLVPLTYHSQDGSFSICCLQN